LIVRENSITEPALQGPYGYHYNHQVIPEHTFPAYSVAAKPAPTSIRRDETAHLLAAVDGASAVQASSADTGSSLTTDSEYKFVSSSACV